MSDNHWGESGASSTPQAASDSTKGTGDGRPGTQKEWRLIEKMVNSLHVEHRRSRRWGIFFKLLTFVYLFSLLAIFYVGKDLDADKVVPQDHTAIVEVKGPIMDDEEASADTIIHALRDAFKAERSRAIILRINSPGGSPVQAGYVYDEIKRLRALHPDKKVYAVITDIGASGAYYIAAAADEIYADKASLVGSIGVISSSFGFVELIDKLGVERRTLTAGENKAFLDPFTPLKDKDREFWQSVLNTTHQQFIAQVKQGRGGRLKGGEEIFSGLVWTGEQALELGLIDGLGSSSMVARDIVGAEKLIDYTSRPKALDRIIERLGIGVAKELALQMGLKSDYQLR
ncbi:signal peptide peptidase SppA [Marinobacterium sediminicola]|uniref:Protease-4 n=1 Tax=Marinobacterium sediminicola TaxID=518898 RepID=A0ABY1RXI7_9GAMM|nr:protease-4 [Marinobacterium sediminicola]